MQKETIKKAFLKSIPILCSYVFVSMAYGITMEEAGFAWYQSLLISLVVYTGAFQFVLVSFLSGGTSIITIAVTALFVIIFIDNWEKTKNHVPAVLGLIISMLCLIIAGARSFMLPSLILVSGVLLLMREKEAQS